MNKNPYRNLVLSLLFALPALAAILVYSRSSFQIPASSAYTGMGDLHRAEALTVRAAQSAGTSGMGELRKVEALAVGPARTASYIGMGDLRKVEIQGADWEQTASYAGMGDLQRLEVGAVIPHTGVSTAAPAVGMGDLRVYEAEQWKLKLSSQRDLVVPGDGLKDRI
jgi:hypothetical protein